jgi:SAM-dependent methyltransferase
MTKKDIQTKITEYYDVNLSQHGLTARGVGWKNDFAQQERFEQLAKILQQPDCSINDLGCGTGAFYDFLLSMGYTSIAYTGYDISEKMIDYAKELHKDHPGASFRHISSAEEIETADYTFASGIFNLKYDSAENEWLEYICRTLDHIHAASIKGFAFNMLTKYSDEEKKNAELYYCDPLFIFDYCVRRYSRKVALLHDYEQYDFTVLIRK